MNASLAKLLDGLFDYAGLFPPAKLEMKTALAQYELHRKGPERWMVSRFICTAGRLEEFAQALAETPVMAAVSLSVVGRPSTDYDQWQEALEKDARDLTGFLAAVGNSVSVEAYEIRIPSSSHVEACLRDLRAFSQVDVFAELPWGDEIDDSLSQIAMTDAIFAKARTGGPGASAFPSADSLAGFLHSAVSLELPFKLTAGLHHPYPVDDVATGGRMHGFLNVLWATAMAIEQDLSRAEVAEILLSDQIPIENLDEETAEDLRDLFVGIGTCSIEEPIADLTAIGLYP